MTDTDADLLMTKIGAAKHVHPGLMADYVKMLKREVKAALKAARLAELDACIKAVSEAPVGGGSFPVTAWEQTRLNALAALNARRAG